MLCFCILIVIMMPGVTANELDLTLGYQKYVTHRVNSTKEPPRTSLYLEDVPELPDYSDADHDGWSRHHQIGAHQLTTFDV